MYIKEILWSCHNWFAMRCSFKKQVFKFPTKGTENFIFVEFVSSITCYTTRDVMRIHVHIYRCCIAMHLFFQTSRQSCWPLNRREIRRWPSHSDWRKNCRLYGCTTGELLGSENVDGKLYNCPSLIRTPLLPRNFVIREVAFGEREHHMHSQHLLPGMCVPSRGVSSLEVSFKRETTVFLSYSLILCTYAPLYLSTW